MIAERVEAVTGEVVEPDWPTCKHGHPQDPSSVVFAKCRDGKSRPRCRICRNQSVQRVRQRQSGAPNPPALLNAFSPRLRGNDTPVANTVSIFSLLPSDFRHVLAARIMAAQGTPLQLATLRRASEQRIWDGTSERHAVVRFIEAVIDLTVDARSPDLRPDRVIAVLLND